MLRVQSDKDYLSDGQGYLGIQMFEEIAHVKGDDEARTCIRVTMVVRGSPAAKAGLRVGDLIASIDGKVWRKPDAITEFMKIIAESKPLQTVKLKILRVGNDDPIEISVTLGRRPVEDLNRMRVQSLQQLDKEARDHHFNQWLKKQKKLED